MMRTIQRLMNSFNHTVMSLSMREWMVITGIMVVFGVICMRGYGSRKNY